MKRSLLIGLVSSITLCQCINAMCYGYSAAHEVGVSEPNTRLVTAMNRARIDLRTLTAAGLSSSDVTAAIGAVSEKLGQIGTDLDTSGQAVQSAKASLALAQAQARSNNTSTALGAMASAQSGLDSALESERALVNQLRDSVKSVVSEPAAAKLASIWANLHRGIDVVYLLSSRSESDWNRLRDNLNQRKAAQRTSQSVPTPVAAYLAEVEAESAVVAAVSALQNNLSANSAAWASAVNPQ